MTSRLPDELAVDTLSTRQRSNEFSLASAFNRVLPSALRLGRGFGRAAKRAVARCKKWNAWRTAALARERSTEVWKDQALAHRLRRVVTLIKDTLKQQQRH
jgi:hypothetical protein